MFGRIHIPEENVPEELGEYIKPTVLKNGDNVIDLNPFELERNIELIKSIFEDQ